MTAPAAGPVNAAFGKRVRIVRTRLGWSQRELTRRAGLRTPGTVCRVESGASICLDGAAAIAAALSMPLNRLTDRIRCQVCADIPPAGFTCQDCGTPGAMIEVP